MKNGSLKISIICLIVLFFSMGIFAKNLGVYGQIYSISEPDLLTFIHQKLESYQKDGKLAQMESDFIQNTKEHVLNPEPVSSVFDSKTGDKKIVFFYKPTVTLQHNIVDASGKILFLKGTKINPLNPESVSSVAPNTTVPYFDETLIFIDSNNQNQINFTKKLISNIKSKNTNAIYKVILVNGNLKKASDELGRIYFDQDGVLCHLFHITRVPAVVTRDNNQLKIVEEVI